MEQIQTNNKCKSQMTSPQNYILQPKQDNNTRNQLLSNLNKKAGTKIKQSSPKVPKLDLQEYDTPKSILSTKQS